MCQPFELAMKPDTIASHICLNFTLPKTTLRETFYRKLVFCSMEAESKSVSCRQKLSIGNYGIHPRCIRLRLDMRHFHMSTARHCTHRRMQLSNVLFFDWWGNSWLNRLIDDRSLPRWLSCQRRILKLKPSSPARAVSHSSILALSVSLVPRCQVHQICR